jgi:outer membrane protein assembly factor BamB
MKNSTARSTRPGILVALLGTLLAGTATGVQAADPLDWPHWRGPEMNGISREKGIVAEWNPKGDKNVLWKSAEAGGRSTPIVMNGKIYTIVRDQVGTKKEGEKVLCLDAATGKKEWEYRFNVFLSDVPDTRVGWSCVTGDPETGNIFALGVCGQFQCLRPDGTPLWEHSLSEEYGLLSTYGGRTNVPLVYRKVVVISAVVIGWGKMAKPAHRFIAFDKRNGSPVWFEGTRPLPYDTTYSSPVLTVINGQRLMIFGSGDGGIHAFQPLTGRKIWTYNVSRRGVNTTPLVVGNTIYSGHSEENIDSTKMGALFAIDGSKAGDITKSGEKWRVTEWFVGKSSPIHIDGRIYAAEDKGTFLVVNAADGKLIKRLKLRGAVRASPLYVDGKIFVCTSTGFWWTLAPDKAAGVKVLNKTRFRGIEVYGSPIVSHGRLYVPTTSALYCIGVKDAKPTADKIPDPPKETEREADAEVAHVQVVPVECLLKPTVDGGQSQEFQARLFNAKGQFLRVAAVDEVTFSLQGTGKISKQDIPADPTTGVKAHKGWQYATPKDLAHTAVAVTGTFGKIQGHARIRLIPDYNWKFDFNDGQVPVTWVGCRYRHISVDFKLLKKLEKESPLASQLYLYLMTSFTNSSKPTVATGKAPHVYNDATPRRTWSALLKFLGLSGQIKTIAEAKAKLDPALAILAREKFVAKHAWGTAAGGLQLAVTRGPRKVDGNGVMVKIKTIPKGARSQGWMGFIDGSNYTIQSDVQGAIKDNKLPDIGLSAQRYTLTMLGASQKLQIRSWPTQLRMAQTEDFKWDPNKWYTMKLEARVQKAADGTQKAVLRGKVWVRGEKEPDDWQVTAVDEAPNVKGSPGLFGNAIDAEIFYDNLTVTKDK